MRDMGPHGPHGSPRGSAIDLIIEKVNAGEEMATNSGMILKAMQMGSVSLASRRIRENAGCQGGPDSHVTRFLRCLRLK